ncbi:HipA N-terminal domain-containing protein [Pedobacter soli]|uniref:HipA N-terminal domain-containing protein n=1 Tax=Pedobacter soli TaxID=390242 RepID=UPI000B882DD2|nr:HipA N-terminal domain-containing protein [Pedobacter soli]
MFRQAKIYYQNQLAGSLSETDNGYTFQYDFGYLKSENAFVVSLTLPLSENPYHNKVLFPFFDGLIPEGWLLDIGEKYWKLNPNDRFELLINLCRDTIGAVSVYPVEVEGNG